MPSALSEVQIRLWLYCGVLFFKILFIWKCLLLLCTVLMCKSLIILKMISNKSMQICSSWIALKHGYNTMQFITCDNWTWIIQRDHKTEMNRDGLMTASWWHHQMETFPLYWPFVRGIHQSGEVPAQRPVMRSFDVFFDLCLNKRLNKQLRGWWFEMISGPLWCHYNDISVVIALVVNVSPLLHTFPETWGMTWY